MAAKGASQPLILRALAHPLHHCLIAAYFPVWLVSNNPNLFDTSDALRPVVIGVGLSVAVFLAFRWLCGNSHKAAIVTTIGILLFFCFSLVREPLPIASKGMAATAILGAVSAGAAYFILKSRRVGRTATIILNGFAFALLLLPAIKIAAPEMGMSIASGMRATAHDGSADDGGALTALPTGDHPSIVHIVLDGYSRADVLKTLYGHDNGAFIDAIRAEGFTVAEQATAPYSQTPMSMNAIFALDYINDRIADLGKTGDTDMLRATLNGDLNQSRLLRALRSAGYSIASVESLYKGVALTSADQIISSADARLGVTFFETTLLHYTPIERLIVRLGIDDERYSKTKFALETHELGTIPRPFFLYNHILAPHPPFNMTRNGNHQAETFGMGDGFDDNSSTAHRYEAYRAGYVDKLHFANAEIIEKIRKIKAEVPDPKIIVLHSDHGGGLYLHKENRARTCMKERLSAFLAVYASDASISEAFTAETNLVNIYRTIFREAFGSTLPALPSRSYFATWSEPEKLSRVRDDELSEFGPTCNPSAPLPAERGGQLSQIRHFTAPSSPRN